MQAASMRARVGADDAYHPGLCGGQICVTPDFASFTNPETEPWLQKFYTINDEWKAEDRRRLLAYARDLLNSDYAGHRLTFQLFAQSPPFAHLLAVYCNFDFAEPMRNRPGVGRVVRAGRPDDRNSARWRVGNRFHTSDACVARESLK